MNRSWLEMRDNILIGLPLTSLCCPSRRESKVTFSITLRAVRASLATMTLTGGGCDCDCDCEMVEDRRPNDGRGISDIKRLQEPSDARTMIKVWKYKSTNRKDLIVATSEYRLVYSKKIWQGRERKGKTYFGAGPP